jgi:hypothetical protein
MLNLGTRSGGKQGMGARAWLTRRPMFNEWAQSLRENRRIFLLACSLDIFIFCKY